MLWKNALDFVVKRTKVNSYDSIYGGQYTELFPNETIPGEWTVEIVRTDEDSTTTISTVKFMIFSVADRNISARIISKYFHRIDFCVEVDIDDLSNCQETSWSESFSDPKSYFSIDPI